MLADRATILAHPPFETAYSYGCNDTMLHGLAIGLGLDPMDRAQLAFVYDPALKVFPTQACVLGWVDMVRDPRARNPALGIDPDRMVVGETSLRVVAPLPVAGTGHTRSYFAEVIDKGPGKAGLVCVRKDVLDAGGALLASMDTWLYVRDGGGFGGPNAGGPPRVDMPQRAADTVCDLATPGNLALLYRQALRDQNALHADPDYAQRVGFARPILHGLANFSIGVHAVLRCFAGYDAVRFRSAQVTLSGPVYPGDTLRTELWADGGSVRFRSTALERNVLVMDRGMVELSA
jgi:acyl dehydratase